MLFSCFKGSVQKEYDPKQYILEPEDTDLFHKFHIS
jgi:hypothetical protein